jgi:hypothetical protein
MGIGSTQRGPRPDCKLHQAHRAFEKASRGWQLQHLSLEVELIRNRSVPQSSLRKQGRTIVELPTTTRSFAMHAYLCSDREPTEKNSNLLTHGGGFMTTTRRCIKREPPILPCTCQNIVKHRKMNAEILIETVPC